MNMCAGERNEKRESAGKSKQRGMANARTTTG